VPLGRGVPVGTAGVAVGAAVSAGTADGDACGDAVAGLTVVAAGAQAERESSKTRSEDLEFAIFGMV